MTEKVREIVYSPFPTDMSRDSKVCCVSAAGPAFFNLGPTADIHWQNAKFRVFVSVSRSFLDRFQKFKDQLGEHVKTILMN